MLSTTTPAGKWHEYFTEYLHNFLRKDVDLIQLDSEDLNYELFQLIKYLFVLWKP